MLPIEKTPNRRRILLAHRSCLSLPFRPESIPHASNLPCANVVSHLGSKPCSLASVHSTAPVAHGRGPASRRDSRSCPDTWEPSGVPMQVSVSEPSVPVCLGFIVHFARRCIATNRPRMHVRRLLVSRFSPCPVETPAPCYHPPMQWGLKPPQFGLNLARN